MPPSRRYLTLTRNPAPALLGVVVGVSALYALMRWTPRLWWAIAGGVLAVFFFATVWAPDALVFGAPRFAQAPPGAVRDGVVALLRSTGIPRRTASGVEPRAGLDADVTGDHAPTRAWP